MQLERTYERRDGAPMFGLIIYVEKDIDFISLGHSKTDGLQFQESKFVTWDGPNVAVPQVA